VAVGIAVVATGIAAVAAAIGAPAGGGPTGRAASARQRRQSAARARETRLRNRARELRGCLDALPGFDRKVIVLRAGIGTDARSRRAVAERLGVSVDRVRRAERSGLRGLREADSDFGCASGGASSGPGGANGTGGVGLAIASGGAAPTPPGPSSSRAARWPTAPPPHRTATRSVA
jgi:uncharacterized membrane protein YgcG